MFRNILALVLVSLAMSPASPSLARQDGAILVLSSNNLKPNRTLTLDGLFYETAAGRVALPATLTSGVRTIAGAPWSGDARMPDGRLARVTVSPQGGASY